MRVKRIAVCAFLSFLLIVYQGVVSVPADMTMFQGEIHTVSTPLAVSISPKDDSAIRTEKSHNFTGETLSFSPADVGKYEYKVSAFGIPLRSIAVEVKETKLLMASGEAVGVKIYASGLMTVGFADIGTRCPALESGMAVGDVILSVNNKTIKDSKHFSTLLHENGAKSIELRCRRGDSEYTVKITPEANGAGGYSIGAWVRDSIAGVGTLTFYDPEDGRFVSLGHSISDYDTGERVEVGKGSIVPCRIQSVIKGESGKAGELCGVFSGGEDLGIIYENAPYGVVGELLSDTVTGVPLPMGVSSQIHTGEASVRTTTRGNEVKEYEIQIEKVLSLSGSKNMIISVTDPDLLEVTGGIVQGMSGSPIIQDGKLMGAVTHVFVDDPTRGYGIFIENMLK